MASETMAEPAVTRRGFARGFRRLWGAITLSGLGDGIRITAFAVFAASLTDDPFQVALVTVATRLPWLCVGPFAGALADRVDRWRTLWLCDAVRAGLVGLFAALALTGHVGIPVLAVTAFLLSSVETLADNLAQAMVPDVTGDASLDSANSRLMGGQMVTTEFLGAPLGAFLFGVSHALPFALDAVSFALSAVLILSIRKPRTGSGTGQPGSAGQPAPAGLRAQTAEGIRWLRGHRVLRTVCVLAGALNFSVLAVLSVAVLYALEVLGIGRDAYGLLMVIIALGGLAGLLAAPAVVKRLGRAGTLRLACVLCPPAFLVPALTTDPFLAAGVLSLVGAAIALVNVVSVSLRQVLVPTELFGRVNGAYRLVVNGLSPLGGLAGGAVAARFGLQAPFLMSAALMAVVTVLALTLLPARGLDAEDGRDRRDGGPGDGTGSGNGAGEGAGAGEGTGAGDGTGAGAPGAPRPALPRAPRPGRRHLPRIVLLAAAVVTALAAAYSTVSPPAPLPASAPAGDFSAAHAHRHIAELATAPHGLGTPEHDRVAARITAGLSALGLRPHEQNATSTDTGSGAALSARVRNISATLPGTRPTGRVLLVAHYDSVETGPGASDDGLGVSSLLETARALVTGPAPRNDITFLFTDGEEPGLMGARAFTAAEAGGHGDPDRTVVLNLEARGTSGRAVMFETGAHNAALVPALSGRPPVATSFSYEVYRLLANDTDFSELRRAGMTGMNFAVVGGSARYHTPQDDPESVSLASLQDMGSAALSATRHLAGADLGAVNGQSDVTYFTLCGLLVRYPGGLVLPLGALTALAFAAALWSARRRGVVRLRTVATAAATLALPLLGAAATGWAGWALLTLVRPDYLGFMLGDPYRPGLQTAGLAIVAAALTWAWAAVLRRVRPSGASRSALELGAGVTTVLVLLTLATALLFPGTSYLFAWPALAGAAGLAVAVRLPERSPWRGACAALAAIPAAALLTPVVIMLAGTVGLVYAAVPLAVVVLLAAPALVAAAPALRARTVVAVTCATALLGATTVAAGTARDTTDARHPVQVSLMYAVDADTGSARWISRGTSGNAWAAGHVPAAATGLKSTFPSLTGPGSWHTGSAPSLPVPLPTLRVDADRREGPVRTVTVHLGSEHGVPTQLMLFADTDAVTVEGARLGTAELPGGENRPTAGSRWKWGLIVAAPGPGGADLTLRVRGDGPLPLRVAAQTPALPEAALHEPRPATVTWSGELSGYTVATRGYRL
ncbi:MFS transporter [Streptomyces sp. URMC 127]|uniref:MFS transporter n=1 Tax=Streptomyces sp. URMC 127 TaxID=3423402 RepID=UPI003F1B4120